MAKNLTFWSVILGFIIGIFANSTEELPLSGYSYGDTRFWRFFILAIIALASAVVFYFIESRNSNKTEIDKSKLRESIIDLNRDIKELIKEMRRDREYVNHDSKDRDAKV